MKCSANTLSVKVASSHGNIDINKVIGIIYKAIILQVTLRTAIGILFAGSLHSPAAKPIISEPWKLTKIITIVMIIAQYP